MENFLDEEKMEQMANEYNKKYSRVSMLQMTKNDKNDICNLLSKTYKFMYMIRECKTPRLNLLFEEGEKIVDYIDVLEKNFDIIAKKNYSKDNIKLNYKNFIFVILDLFEDFFNLSNKNFEEIKKLFYMILAFIKHFFSCF